MLKYALLATAVTLSTPVLAQMQTTPAPTAPSAATSTPPTTSPMDDATTPAQAADSSTAQTPADTGATATQSAQAAPADTGGVNAVVDKEFANYDKDSNGSLSKAEFASWMDALKAKSPNGATAAADPKWNDAAFAQADTDKSKALSKVELASFLSSATKSAS